MKRERENQRLKGSSSWSLVYALSSLRNYPLRNAGIAVILAIGIALPTTVFVWTETGTTLVIDDFFSNAAYQMRLDPVGENLDLMQVDTMVSLAQSSPFIEDVDRLTSTVGILQGEGIPEWDLYSYTGLMYANGIKDGRVIFVTNQLLANWSIEFNYSGNFSLSVGEVLVSEMFLEYTKDVHNIELEIGSEIDVDVLVQRQRGGLTPPEQLEATTVGNLTIAGIYKIKDLGTHLASAFPSITRKSWDPLAVASEVVLGMDDSIFMLQEEIGEDMVEDIESRGYFKSVVLIKPSQNALIQAGAANIGANLLSFKEQFEEQIDQVLVIGVRNINTLEAIIETYLQSQVLTVIVFPVLIMSMMLTIFTSETSVARRKGEISALRSKGASFNQVFSTFMWESLFLALIGLLFGIGLSLIMAPFVGASIGFFIFDPAILVQYFTHFNIPPLSLVIAAVIAMYLPAAFLLHVARRIDVSEVGQPITEQAEEGTEMGSFWRYVVGLGFVLSFLLGMPLLLAPSGGFAVIEILIATLLLFVASYLGSRAMRLVTAKVSGSTSFILGEKSLYMSQSLRKRKGQFIPLLVILTLTLTTTTMMLIQTSSFEATLENELSYSIGSDLRVETSPRSLIFNNTLLQYPGVLEVSPVIETWATVGDNDFYIEGIDARSYMRVGKFSSDSFVNNDSSSVLGALSLTPNGIIISQYYGNLWNKSVGDFVFLNYGSVNDSIADAFEIVGFSNSAPGFGIASISDISGSSFASQFGFQVGRGGFALANIDYISNRTLIETSELFLVSTTCFADVQPMVDVLNLDATITIFSVETFDITSQSYSIQLFMSGIQGLTMISFIFCATMGLSAIALFLGSAVLERRHEYAIFRAIGGTKRQVIAMVFGEFAGTVVAAISISLVLGVLFGYSMALLTFGISPFSPILAEILSLPFTMMLIILTLESAVMLGSCIIPARRAGSVNPADALRNL
ncbi:MAG: ABC transporter permease [Candidatus Thorarchaeota archaeon]|jgi:ABC-type antimicrobial peptide transport system permease subunit